MSAVIVLDVVLGGLEGAAAPSATGGETKPSPVRSTVTFSPGCAGLEGDTSVPSESCVTAPYPSPLFAIVNTPGVVWLTNSVTTFEGIPSLITWNWATAEVISKGTTTETAPGATE
jgi:hypothetical protein